MTINASARKYQIWICTPAEDEATGLEVTDACLGDGAYFSVSDEPIAEDGLQRTSGELNLLVPYGQEEVYDTWENSERWAIGNRVLVQVADESGMLRWHPKSGLYILSHPTPAYPGNWQLKLEIGDRLSLLSFRQPHSNASDITIGQDKSRTAIAASILSSVDLELEGSIAGGLNYPIPKAQSSFVQQAGVVAIAGACFLHQDINGVIQARAIDLAPRTRLFKHEVGKDDAGDYQPMQGNERPVSRFRVVGTGYELFEPNTLSISISQEYAPASTVKEGAGDRQILVATYKKVTSWDGAIYTEIIQEQRSRGLVISDDVYTTLAKGQGVENYTPPDGTGLIYSQISKEVRVFEDSGEGRLLYIKRFVQEPEGAVLGEFYKRNVPARGEGNPFEFGDVNTPFAFANLTRLMASGESTTVYGYSNDGDGDQVRSRNRDTAGQVRSISFSAQQPRARVAGAASNWKTSTQDKRALIPSDRSRSFWYRLSPDEWVHEQTNQKAGELRSGTVAGFSALRVIDRKKDISRSGDAQPPSAERRQPTQERKEIRYRGETEFKPFAGTAYAPRVHPVTIDYMTSDSEAKKLSKLLGLMRVGRHQGFKIVSALRDEWFDYLPMSRIDVAWNGYTYLGVTDLVTWTLAGNEAIVEAQCIRLGRSPGAKGTADPYVAGQAPPLQPIAQVVEEFAIESVDEIDWTFRPIKVGEVLPTQNVAIESVDEISFDRAVMIATVNDIGIARIPILDIATVNDIGIAAVSTGLTLISHWALEGSPWVDSVGSNTLTPIVFGVGGITSVAGVVGDAASFTNASLYSSSTQLATGGTHWELELKLKLSSLSVFSIARRESDTGGWELRMASGNRLQLVVLDSDFNSQSATSTVTIATGTWYNVTVEVNPGGGAIAIEVDGTRTEVALSLTPADSASGTFYFGDSFMTIDEVKFYKD